MYRRTFIAITAAFLLGVSGGVSTAQDTALSASEVEGLLTGNTAEGQWDGKSYRSYFGADGTTIFAPSKGETLTGKWRVNPETGQYDSFWDTIGWTAYTVLRTEDGYAWHKDDKSYPFSLLQGRRLGD